MWKYKGDRTVTQNSDFREHSKNSLESVEGEALQQPSEQRSVVKVTDPEVHKKTSEYRKFSQKSRSSEKDTGEERSGKLVQ